MCTPAETDVERKVVHLESCRILAPPFPRQGSYGLTPPMAPCKADKIREAIDAFAQDPSPTNRAHVLELRRNDFKVGRMSVALIEANRKSGNRAIAEHHSDIVASILHIWFEAAKRLSDEQFTALDLTAASDVRVAA